MSGCKLIRYGSQFLMVVTIVEMINDMHYEDSVMLEAG
jgi:hypothetical protein